MAKIYSNEPPFWGTKDGITIYRMRAEDVCYMRTKSSLTGDRVKNDPAFKGLMKHAEVMRIASPLASAVYKQLPEEKRHVSVYRKMTAMAQRMIKDGESKEYVKQLLEAEFIKRKIRKSFIPIPVLIIIPKPPARLRKDRVNAPPSHLCRNYSP